jgi:alpha-ketoglutaric semialdehyde dehydrogenase
MKHAIKFYKVAKAGFLMVNLPAAVVNYHVPFGGAKGASLGAVRTGQPRPRILDHS